MTTCTTGTYTTEQLERGEGLSSSRPMLAISYDDGKTWCTAEIGDSVKGDPTDVCTVPPSGWENRA